MKFKFIFLSVLFQICLCKAALIDVHLSREDQQRIYNSIQSFLGDDPAYSNVLHREDFRIAAYPDYFVEPRDVAAGRLLSAVKSGGWRLLLFFGTNAAGGTYCKSDPRLGKTERCPEFGADDYPRETAIMAEKLPQIKEQDYEVRVFAAGFFGGLWLHSKSSDIFVSADTTETAFGNFEVFKPYTEGQLIKILQPYEQTELPMAIEANRRFERKMAMYRDSMMNYEKVHGDKRGPIKLVMMETKENLSPVEEIDNFHGVSSDGQKLCYKVKITFSDKYRFDVSRVDVLEKIPPND